MASPERSHIQWWSISNVEGTKPNAKVEKEHHLNID